MRLKAIMTNHARATTLGLMALTVAAMALALHAAWPSSGRAETGSAGIQVIDGDTLQVHGRIVQLYGIDAPELGQRCRHDDTWFDCGLDAAFELSKVIGLEGATLRCAAPTGSPEDGAQECMAGHINVAHALLSGGYVVATPQAGADYHEAESNARIASLGLWHSEFVRPVAWRAGRRLADEPDMAADSCPVKAVVTAAGERLYYVPTDAGYDAMTLDPAKGDRRFCSDEEARAAGWLRQGQMLPSSG